MLYYKPTFLVLESYFKTADILKIKAVISSPKPLHIYTCINVNPQSSISHIQLRKSFAVDSFSHLVKVFICTCV